MSRLRLTYLRLQHGEGCHKELRSRSDCRSKYTVTHSRVISLNYVQRSFVNCVQLGIKNFHPASQMAKAFTNYVHAFRVFLVESPACTNKPTGAPGSIAVKNV